MVHVRRLRIPFAILALAGLVSAGCEISVGENGFSLGAVSGRASDEWQREYTLKPGASVEVVNVNGRIQVTRGTGPAVRIHAERTARALTDESAKELLDQVRIEETTTDAGVKIETKAPRLRGRGGVEVRYTVTVPDGTPVTVRTTNGGIDLDGVTGGVLARTVNGGVSGSGLAGRVEASTTNGGIDLAVDALADGGITAETVNGGVSVSIPRAAGAEVAASVVNGGISLSGLSLDEGATKNRRRLEGKLNGGGPRIKIGAVNGGVQLAGQ
jgi:hypothetical protein